MDLDFQGTVRVFEELKTQFGQAQPNLEKCKELMAKLKLAMTKFSFPGAVSDSEQEKKTTFTNKRNSRTWSTSK